MMVRPSSDMGLFIEHLKSEFLDRYRRPADGITNCRSRIVSCAAPAETGPTQYAEARRLPSRTMHAAVNRNPGTADIATEFGREKYNQRRFLFRLAEPVQRNMESLADEIVDIVFADPQLIGKFLHRWRHDPASADGVYGNA